MKLAMCFDITAVLLLLKSAAYFHSRAHFKVPEKKFGAEDLICSGYFSGKLATSCESREMLRN